MYVYFIDIVYVNRQLNGNCDRYWSVWSLVCALFGYTWLVRIRHMMVGRQIWFVVVLVNHHNL